MYNMYVLCSMAVLYTEAFLYYGLLVPLLATTSVFVKSSVLDIVKLVLRNVSVTLTLPSLTILPFPSDYL